MSFPCIRCKRELDPEFRACPHCGEPVTDFLRRYLREPIDGKYKLVERLGAGGMGEVYKVEHTYLGATRVVKVIRPQISESRDAHDRFLREARLATKVQHQNVATLHDFSALPDGSHYMVWEYIDGENVAQRLRARGVLPPREAVRITIDALRGLEAIHRAGIVHRDISPENLMIARESGAVKIIDLGGAKTEEPSDNATRAGVFVGKLRYASPEHLGFLNEDERIDGRADLYSLAMVLFEMLTGRPPFEAKSPHEYILMHSRATELRTFELPPSLPGGAALQNVLQRALARDRARRYQTAGELAAALEDVERQLPDQSAVKTMHVATPDLDTTWRAPEHAQPTIRTPLPSAGPATARTQITDVREGRRNHSGLIIGALILVIVALGLMLLMRPAAEPAPTPIATNTATVAPQPEPPTSTASMEVLSAPIATNTATVASTPAATATQPPARVEPEPVVTKSTRPPAPVREREPEPEREPQPTPAPAPAPVPANVAVFTENGDSDRNDAAIEQLRRAVAGVSRIALRGPNAGPLALALREEAPSITIDENAEVIVQFEGSVERLGLGRKRRSGTAVVTKNGRAIFGYEMPAEDYRVGDTPAEALARILSDVLEE